MTVPNAAPTDPGQTCLSLPRKQIRPAEALILGDLGVDALMYGVVVTGEGAVDIFLSGWRGNTVGLSSHIDEVAQQRWATHGWLTELHARPSKLKLDWAVRCSAAKAGSRPPKTPVARLIRRNPTKGDSPS